MGQLGQYLFSRLIKPNETVESSQPVGSNKTAGPYLFSCLIKPSETVGSSRLVWPITAK